MSTPRRIIRLAHPWLFHYPGDIIDTANPDHRLTVEDADRLVRATYATDITNLIEGPNEGGWYTYTKPDGEHIAARSRDELIDELTTPPDVAALDDEIPEPDPEE